MQQMFGIDLCSKCNEPEEGGCGLGGWRHDDDAAAAVKNAVKGIRVPSTSSPAPDKFSGADDVLLSITSTMTTHLLHYQLVSLSGVGRKCHRVLDLSPRRSESGHARGVRCI